MQGALAQTSQGKLYLCQQSRYLKLVFAERTFEGIRGVGSLRKKSQKRRRNLTENKISSELLNKMVHIYNSMECFGSLQYAAYKFSIRDDSPEKKIKGICCGRNQIVQESRRLEAEIDGKQCYPYKKDAAIGDLVQLSEVYNHECDSFGRQNQDLLYD